MWRFAPLVLISILAFSGCDDDRPADTLPVDTASTTPAPRIPEYTYRIVHQYPHDTSAFTQGLVFHDGRLFESTGREGLSTLREVELESGRVIRRFELPEPYFAEGLALLGTRLYQLTWRSYVGFVYDLSSLRQIDTFQYVGEGWGITSDGARLIMSDGSDTFRFLDPEDGTVDSTLTVRVPGAGGLRDLNELEWIDGEIWANVWQTERIARVDPKTGAVLGWVDLSGILSDGRTGREDVLNGIAYDPATKRIFVTGKLWPFLYEIQVVPKAV